MTDNMSVNQVNVFPSLTNLTVTVTMTNNLGNLGLSGTITISSIIVNNIIYLGISQFD